MCKSWELDIQYDFNSDPWTCTVLKDKTVGEAHKEQLGNEVETVKAVLAGHHEENDGAGLNQGQLLNLLKTVDIGRLRAETILSRGINKHWTTKVGKRNSVLYHLIGWTAEERVL